MKFSIYLSMGKSFWVTIYEIPIKESIERIAKYGYDGIEIMPEDPTRVNINEIKEIINEKNLEVAAIGSGQVYTYHHLSFIHPNKEIREKAIKKVNECIDFARKIDSKIVIIGLVKGKIEGGISLDKAWENLIECIKKCGEYAEKYDIKLAIEPDNRYETDIVNNADEALKLIKEVNLKSVKLMLDTFHMNIEEVSFYQTIKNASKELIHFHVADSNRCAPGMGHINFKEIMDALKEINYNGFIGIEVLPKPNADEAARISIEYLKKLL